MTKTTTDRLREIARQLTHIAGGRDPMAKMLRQDIVKVSTQVDALADAAMEAPQLTLPATVVPTPPASTGRRE